MSRREKEKERSLAALGKIAYSAGAPLPSVKPALPTPPPRPIPAAAKPPPAAKKPPQRPQQSRDPLEGRQAKLEEAKLLRERREQELFRSKNLEWRGMGGMDHVPASIRRTAFDRQEPSLLSKIDDVLGAPREKDGRAKNRDKGRRQGGR